MATTDNEPDVIPVDIPNGWRLLGVRELTEPGDRWLTVNGWMLCDRDWSMMKHCCPPVIRRIDERVEKVIKGWEYAQQLPDAIIKYGYAAAIELLREKGVL